MCGIFGIFDPERRLEESHLSWADQAAALLRHRGPDGQGQKIIMDERCLLGHLRLAIIDLMHGAQPMSNEDGTVWVICNGEIYNYIELRRDLVHRGHAFSSDGDVEILVHLYEEKGTALLDELEGMYAFAIVDTKKRLILLARDRFGEKPLYWARVGTQGLTFASEMKALLPLSEIKRHFDVPGLAQFLAQGYIPAPRTHLEGIRKLRAGEALVLSAGTGLRTFRYWEPEFTPETAGDLTSKEASDMLTDRFNAAVRLRLRSDVPVGAFLSGGIDSTLVASTIRQLRPGIPLKTFCVGFDDDTFNEAPYARQVAERLDSEHCELHFSSAELLQIFDALISHYDEPFADASMFPTFAVCRAARQSCKVMLSGEGGDELFGGYRGMFSYFHFHSLRRFPGLNQAASLALRNWPNQWRGRNLLGFLQKSDWDLLHADETQDVLSWFQPAYRDEARHGLQEVEESAKRHARLRFPSSAMESESSSYLPEQILVKVDRASMLCGLECRTPFLDRQLFAFAASLPAKIHFAHGQGKALLRRSLPDFVPPEIRWRSKQGFTPPLANWFRTSLRSQLDSAIAEISTRLNDFFVPEFVADLNRQHLAGADHSPALFRWLVLSRVAGINC
ncbi:MAG TPA: asparagine synthase (glutamine-hydrolyzing) [Terriglobales bacterium]|nr:asparagine synthase (glutamine-hydrolyzing) [Terriglobales bacterium]